VQACNGQEYGTVIAKTVFLLTQQVVFGKSFSLKYSTFSNIFDRFVSTNISL